MKKLTLFVLFACCVVRPSIGLAVHTPKNAYSMGSIQKDPIAELRQYLFTEAPDIVKARIVLKRIRSTKNLGLAVELKEVFIEVKERIATGYQKRTDPYKTIQYEIEATIIALDMAGKGATTSSAKTDYLIAKVEDGLSRKKVINAELILLGDEAGAAAKDLIHTIDTSSNTRLQLVMLSALRNSEDPDLENQILKRITKHEDNKAVYTNMLLLLSEKGGVKTYNYLISKLDKGSAPADSTLSNILKRLSETTRDTALQKRIQSRVENMK